MANLPYVTAPGNIDKAMRGIKAAATPDRVSQDFVKTILKIPGGSGDQMTSFLKKIGFANADGTTSEMCKRFRNPATSGRAAADALKYGYRPLYVRNEYMHQLSDEKIKGLIIEETGQEQDSSVVALILASVKAVKKFADWSDADLPIPTARTEVSSGEMSRTSEALETQSAASRLGLNLSYTINLNLPATSDVAVFNAIFKSLKENLLRSP